jgi:hypothetical protein
MVGIVKKTKMPRRHMTADFRRTGGLHCETSALRKVAGHAGVDVSEEMLLGVGGGIGFIYWHAKGMPVPFIGGRNKKTQEILVDAYKRLGGSIKIGRSADGAKGHEALVKHLAKGEPVVCYGDMAFLPYFAAPEGAHFGGHAFVVYGLDEERDRVYISDRGRKWITVTTGELMKARSSKHEPFPPKNALLKINHPKKTPDFKKAILAGIKECCAAMLKPPIKNFGLAGMETWEKKLSTWSTDFKARRFVECLENVFIYIETGGTGGGAFRPMYARFLLEAAAMLKKPRLKEGAVLFEESGRKWRELACAALPDNVEPLRWMRQCHLERNRLFEEGPYGNVETMLKANEALEALAPRAVEALTPSAVVNILQIMGDKIREIRTIETKAFALMK